MSAGQRELPNRFHVVSNPLDMIQTLESGRSNYEVVVLTDRFAENPELVSFLAKTYPSLRILSGNADEEPDPYLPAFA